MKNDNKRVKIHGASWGGKTNRWERNKGKKSAQGFGSERRFLERIFTE
jgi:hypothetical protein